MNLEIPLDSSLFNLIIVGNHLFGKTIFSFKKHARKSNLITQGFNYHSVVKNVLPIYI